MIEAEETLVGLDADDHPGFHLTERVPTTRPASGWWRATGWNSPTRAVRCGVVIAESI